MSKLSTIDKQALLALQLTDSGHLANAADICQQLIQSYPLKPDGWYVLGLVCYGLGETQKAETLIQKAISLAPAIKKFNFMDGLLRHQNEFTPYTSHYFQYLNYKQSLLTDAFLISWPKAGRTWLRVLLGEILAHQFHIEDRDRMELAELVEDIPGAPVIEVSHDDYPHWKPIDRMENNKQVYKNNRIMFLVRDPRDVMVSQYFQYTLRNDKEKANDADFNGSLSDFIRHPIGGIESLVKFYNIWAKNRNRVKAFLLIRYEDLHQNPESILTNILNFVGLNGVSREIICQAIEACSFENMREQELKGSSGNARLKSEASEDQNALKTREGKVGGYVNYLSADDIAFVEDVINTRLDDFYSFYKYSRE